MKTKGAWRSRAERARSLRAYYDKSLERHELLSRAVVDESRAMFEIGVPGDSAYYAEVCCVRAGLFVHGDVDTVLFERCSYKTWQQKLAWMRGDNVDYAEEKASIGSGLSEMARVVDGDVAIGDLLYWRREGVIDKDDAADIYKLISDGDLHEAQAELYRKTGDFELRLGVCTSPRVIMGLAVVTTLCRLLAATGEEFFEP
jgi:hypothetical protein